MGRMNNRTVNKERTALAVYCRRPETKRVKTRLARTIGPDAARRFYAGCLTSLRRDLNILGKRLDIVICPSDEKDAGWAARFFPSHKHIVPQIYGDLGMRIEHTDLMLRCQGYARIILVGSDAPSLPLGYIEDVDNFLVRADVALGPCADGGVYALGSCVPLMPLDSIPWGTEAVFARLQEKFQREGFKVRTSTTWYDVDRAEDLVRVYGDLRRSSLEHRRSLGNMIEGILDPDSSDENENSWYSSVEDDTNYFDNGGKH